MKTSAKFQAYLGAGQITLDQYVIVTNNSGKQIRLSLTEGTITVDRNASQRRTANITCFDPDGTQMPSGPSDFLAPFGSELQAFSGVKYPDGTSEVYSMGVFSISECSIDDSNPLMGRGTTINLTAYDRSRKVSRNKFTQPYSITAGTLITDAIQVLVKLSYPGINFNVSGASSLTLPYVLTYAIGDDPWQACQDLASSVGCEVFFDVNGDCVVKPPADVSSLGAPVWSYVEGLGNTMTDINRVLSDDPGYNGVIVVGANTGTDTDPVVGAAWDDEPSSPTYYKGPYGMVPQVIQDQNITTVDDATSSAQSQLNGWLGFSTSVTVTAWMNPAIDVDDCVYVQRDRVKASGKFVVDSFSLPMGGSTQGTPAAYTEQNVVLRQQRKVS